MGDENQAESLREVVIADHLWSSLQKMAADMELDRDAVVHQAMMMFARLNGFLLPRAAAAPVAAAPAARVVPDEDAARRAVAKHVMDTAAEFEGCSSARRSSSTVDVEPLPTRPTLRRPC